MINQPVSLCNLSDKCATVQLFQDFVSDAIVFFQTFYNAIAKKNLYELPHRHVFYIKLFFCSFLFEISFRANICFQ